LSAARNGSEDAKIEALADWRHSYLFDQRKRLALEMSERMTYTRRRVTDSLFARLRKCYSDQELVELAAVIALENFRSKFNPTFGVVSGEACALAWVQEQASQAALRSH
jgi:alkylhydroperoxidase family enzyme